MVKFTFKADNKATVKTVVELAGNTLNISTNFGEKVHSDDCEYGMKVRLASIGRDSIQALEKVLKDAEINYTITENVHVEKADDTAKRIKALAPDKKAEFLALLEKLGSAT